MAVMSKFPRKEENVTLEEDSSFNSNAEESSDFAYLSTAKDLFFYMFSLKGFLVFAGIPTWEYL